MTEVNLKYESELEKAFSYKGTIRPEDSDKEGMAHPDPSKPYVKGTSAHGPAWFYKPEVARQHEQKFMSNYNNFIHKLSPEGRKHMHSLGRQVAMDPDKHAIATGTPDGQALRLRHLTAAMGVRPGYSISEVPGGLKISAARHSGNRENQGETHTWHFDGKNLKFSGKMSKSSYKQGDEYARTNQRQEVGRADARAKEAGGTNPNPGRGRPGSPRSSLAKTLSKRQESEIQAETDKINENKKTSEAHKPHEFKPAKWTHPNGHPRCILCGDEEPVSGKCEGVKLEKSSDWHVKVKGVDGYHPVKDIKDLGPGKGNNYVLHDGREIHQDNIEDMKMGKLDKAWKDQLPGGLADDRQPEDFDHKQLKMGVKVELEHTNDRQKALEIAMDHLTENPEYYTRLQAIEPEHLDKGARGDWQKEGYELNYTQDPDDRDIHEVHATGPRGESAGRFLFWEHENHVVPGWAGVHNGHERKGLATAAYKMIEQKTGKKLMPDSIRSDDAIALWSQKNRPFGKSLKKSMYGGDMITAAKIEQMTPGRNPLLGRIEIPDIRTEGRVFVSLDGDNIGASVERAAMKDDLRTIIEQTHLIAAGQRMIREWAKGRHADIYIDGGDDIAFTLPVMYIDELHDLRQLYRARTGFTVTIGVGDTISHAGHAMLFGKLSGKDQVNEWTPELETKLNKLSRKLTPAEKIAEHGLMKARLAKRLKSMTSLKKSQDFLESVDKTREGSEPIPHVASVAVIDPDSGRILMGRRNDTGRWTLPGGHLEGDETPIKGAMRELWEEAGVRTNRLSYLGSEAVMCADGKRRMIHAFSMYGKPKTTGKYDPDEEVSKWMWVPKKLPDSVRNNLEAKKNVTLKLLGIQNDT